MGEQSKEQLELVNLELMEMKKTNEQLLAEVSSMKNTLAEKDKKCEEVENKARELEMGSSQLKAHLAEKEGQEKDVVEQNASYTIQLRETEEKLAEQKNSYADLETRYTELEIRYADLKKEADAKLHIEEECKAVTARAAKIQELLQNVLQDVADAQYDLQNKRCRSGTTGANDPDAAMRVVQMYKTQQELKVAQARLVEVETENSQLRLSGAQPNQKEDMDDSVLKEEATLLKNRCAELETSYADLETRYADLKNQADAKLHVEEECKAVTARAAKIQELLQNVLQDVADAQYDLQNKRCKVGTTGGTANDSDAAMRVVQMYKAQIEGQTAVKQSGS